MGISLEWGPQILFGQDWFKFLNVFLFAFSNGYLMTQCAIIAPSFVGKD